MIGLAFALGAMAVGSLVLVIIGHKATLGMLSPNRWAGIRTPYTYSSDEAWYTTHRHAGPIMERAGYVVLVGSLACAALALAGVLGAVATTIAILVLTAIVLGAAVASWWVGTSRARRELGQR